MAAVHLTKDGGQQFKDDFRAINPQARVPALQLSGGEVLTQSLAIIDYLDEVYPDPPLLPVDALDRVVAEVARHQNGDRLQLFGLGHARSTGLPVDWRTCSSGLINSCEGRTVCPLSLSSSALAARRPTSRWPFQTVVSAGVAIAASSRSS